MLGQFREQEIVFFFWFGPEFDAFDLSVNCFRQLVCKLIGIKSNFGAYDSWSAETLHTIVN